MGRAINQLKCSRAGKIAAVALFVSTITISHAIAELRFELENPFRFFRHQSDYAVHRIAFDLALSDANAIDRNGVAVGDIERRLADPIYWTRRITNDERRRAAWPQNWTGSSPLEIIESLRRNERRPTLSSIAESAAVSSLEVVRRFGWASLLDTHLSSASTAVCWNRIERLHTSCPDYVSPSSWRVRVFDDAAPPGECDWEIGDGGRFASGAQRRTSGLCEAITIEVVARLDATESVQTPHGRTRVIRHTQSGADTPLEVTIRDDLIVGLGDSYSSGEGNPDRPVILSPNLIASGAALPRRPDDNPKWAAAWIDRSCHRSAYSWQLRSALHQALIQPSRAVTFLSYACSGAEIVEGLLFAWRGPEPTLKHLPFRPQIAAVYEDLCKTKPPRINPGTIPREESDDYLERLKAPADYPWKAREEELAKRIVASLRCGNSNASPFIRPIDALLLGIGGNDVGFARWIAGAILDRAVVKKAAGGFIPRLENCEADRAACRLTEARLARLESRLRVLRNVLENRLLRDAGLPEAKVFVAAYPKATNGTDGKVCPSGNGGMTVSVWPGPRGNAFKVRASDHLNTIEQFRRDHLAKKVMSFTEGAERPFTVVSGFVDAFATHGFCATERNQEQVAADFRNRDLFNVEELAGRDAVETLHMPRLGAPRVRGSIVVDPEVWRPFRPTAWQPYAHRARWFRTPNDVFMIVNNKPSVVQEGSLFGILDLRNRGSSGAFHPTAEGHAEMASHVANSLAVALAQAD